MAGQPAVAIALLVLLFARVDVAKPGKRAHRRSLRGWASRSGFYAVSILVMVWRWWLLLEAQDVSMPVRALRIDVGRALFNNFSRATSAATSCAQRHGEGRAFEDARRDRHPRRPGPWA